MRESTKRKRRWCRLNNGALPYAAVMHVVIFSKWQVAVLIGAFEAALLLAAYRGQICAFTKLRKRRDPCSFCLALWAIKVFWSNLQSPFAQTTIKIYNIASDCAKLDFKAQNCLRRVLCSASHHSGSRKCFQFSNNFAVPAVQVLQARFVTCV